MDKFRILELDSIRNVLGQGAAIVRAAGAASRARWTNHDEPHVEIGLFVQARNR
jgi:hypothetical protein